MPFDRSDGATPQHSIVARGIARSFVSGSITTTVLAGLSVSIEPGGLTLIAGPSGSGKSTLLAILSGLLRPDRGEVTVLGTRIWDLAPDRIDAFRLLNCGFVFQGFNLFPALTAVEQVMLPLNYGAFTGSNPHEAAMDALVEVGLAGQAHLRPAELSGGEKQRVAIARALVKKPRLVFADEPTSALDSENGRIVSELLHSTARSVGATVLCVSHDPRLIEHADRIIRIEDGSIRSDQLCRAPSR